MVLFTCSIFPHLTKIWYDYTRKVLGNEVEIFIYDCSGMLDPKKFDGAKVIKHPNDEHGKKIDHFINTVNSKYVLIIDDDAFLVNKEAYEEVKNKLEKDSLAIYSLHERHFWKYKINEVEVTPIGTYAFGINAEVIKKENLSMKSVRTKEEWVNAGNGYWDTANFAQFELLKRNYTIGARKNNEENICPTLFGTSSGFMALFKKRFLLSGYKRRMNNENLLTHLKKDLYFLNRVIAVATIIRIYNELYGEVNLDLSISLEELNSIQKTYFQNSTVSIDRPIEIMNLILEKIGK